MTESGRMFRRVGLMFAAVLASCAIAPGIAQADLVNITTPNVLAPQQLDVRADVRAFGGEEGATYLGLGARYGVAKNWEVGIGGSFTPFDTYAISGGGTIRHGGSDVELTAKYAIPVTGPYALSGQVGLAFPNTPAERSTDITLGITGSWNAIPKIQLYVNPRAVFVTDNTIVGFGLGAKVKLTNQLYLVGDYTPILTGSNTIDVNSGNQTSHDVYGLALRYAVPKDNLSVDLGWTNGTGLTTGTSLTPGLGSSSAFYVAVTLKR